jgi:hypothetical protein
VVEGVRDDRDIGSADPVAPGVVHRLAALNTRPSGDDALMAVAFVCVRCDDRQAIAAH